MEQDTQGYVDRYNEMLKRLYTASRIAARQFVGDKEDPQAQYIINLEIFKNLANFQLAVLNRLIVGVMAGLGVETEAEKAETGAETGAFLSLTCEELEKHLKTMEEDLAIIGWDAEENPVLHLEEFRKKTADWPHSV